MRVIVVNKSSGVLILGYELDYFFNRGWQGWSREEEGFSDICFPEIHIFQDMGFGCRLGSVG